jgi:site-specific DNA recombinase
MQCVLYARVSTDRQAEKELSIPAQLLGMRAYARERGWVVVEEFVETGASGRTTERPSLRALLAKCKDPDSGVGAVLVHKIDRLARNLADHVSLRAILKERGIALASVIENLDDSNAGQLVEHIMASLAEFYSVNLSEEVKKGMRQKVQQGGWPHKPPRGYLLTAAPGGRNMVTVDPVAGPLVRLAFERCGSMEPEAVASLARMLARHGLVAGDGRPLSVWTLLNMLRNPFYAGRVRWGRETHKGAHEPLVSEQLFWRVQQVLARRRSARSRSRKHHVLLRGFASCRRCGRMMTAQTDPRHLYYRCGSAGSPRPCKAPYVRGDRAHAQVEELYRALAVPASVRDEIRIAVRQEAISENRARERWKLALRAELADITRREAQVADRFVAGLLEQDTYALAADSLASERAEIERKLSSASQVAPDQDLRRARTVWDLHNRLAPELQDHLLRMVFRTVRLGISGIEGYALRDAFQAQRNKGSQCLRKVA